MDVFRSWRFAVPILPPSTNHQYRAITKNGHQSKALTETAKVRRGIITSRAEAAGFQAQPGKHYAVEIQWTMPGNADADGPLKAALDAIFGSGNDQSIVMLDIDKQVMPGIRQMDVIITECLPLPPIYRPAPPLTAHEERMLALAAAADKGEPITAVGRTTRSRK